MRLLLVTGFLGAGKTTFLKRLLKLHARQKTAVIVNEFGRAGMDGALLEGLGATLREVTGGSAFCACRLDQFEDALRAVAVEQPDWVFVEASGLSDPSAVKTIVESIPGVAYAGCVALCDAPRLEKALAAVRACAKQLAVADLILLNKTDLVTEEEARRLAALLHERFPLARVEMTAQGAFAPEWLEGLRAHAPALPHTESRDITLQKACVSIQPTMTRAELLQFLRLFAEDTYRVKGAVKLSEGAFIVDCIGSAISVTPCEPAMVSGKLVALAGAGMAMRKSLLTARAWYPDKATEVVFG